jgi:hypothetical protein
MESKKIDFSIFEDAKFKAFKESAKAEEQKWADEIEMLTKRIGDSYEYIELGNGDKIAVRTRLSYAEIELMDKLAKDSNELQKNGKITEANDLLYEMYALISANPLITKEFLREHKDSYSFNDMITLVKGYQECIENIIGGVRNFRKK